MAHLPPPGAGASALVIGASGGIGAALARALQAHEGFATVIGTHRRAAPADVDLAHWIRLDVTDDDDIAGLSDAVRTRTDVLHCVIYCVGVLADDSLGMRPEKRLSQVRREHLDHAFAVNAIAPLLIARELAGLLPRREPCTWAHLSARVGSIGDDRMGGWYAYRASKAAQNMITRNLAIELGRRHRGLLCVALHPGTVATGLSAPFRSAEDEGVMQPETAAGHLLRVIDGLGPEDSGSFHAWNGAGIPW